MVLKENGKVGMREKVKRAGFQVRGGKEARSRREGTCEGGLVVCWNSARMEENEGGTQSQWEVLAAPPLKSEKWVRC